MYCCAYNIYKYNIVYYIYQQQHNEGGWEKRYNELRILQQMIKEQLQPFMGVFIPLIIINRYNMYDSNVIRRKKMEYIGITFLYIISTKLVEIKS